MTYTWVDIAVFSALMIIFMIWGTVQFFRETQFYTLPRPMWILYLFYFVCIILFVFVLSFVLGEGIRAL